MLDVLPTPAGLVKVTTLLQAKSYSFPDFRVNISFRCGLSTLYRISVRFLTPRRFPVGFRVSSLSVLFPKWASSTFDRAVLFKVFLPCTLGIFIRREPLARVADEQSHLGLGVRYSPAGRGRSVIGYVTQSFANILAVPVVPRRHGRRPLGNVANPSPIYRDSAMRHPNPGASHWLSYPILRQWFPFPPCKGAFWLVARTLRTRYRDAV